MKTAHIERSPADEPDELAVLMDQARKREVSGDPSIMPLVMSSQMSIRLRSLPLAIASMCSRRPSTSAGAPSYSQAKRLARGILRATPSPLA